MGSDSHSPEKAPARYVQVSGFFIDPYSVANRQFAFFIAATGYRTGAEQPLDPADYPNVSQYMLKPGAMAFRRVRGPVDLRDISK